MRRSGFAGFSDVSRVVSPPAVPLSAVAGISPRTQPAMAGARMLRACCLLLVAELAAGTNSGNGLRSSHSVLHARSSQQVCKLA